MWKSFIYSRKILLFHFNLFGACICVCMFLCMSAGICLCGSETTTSCVGPLFPPCLRQALFIAVYTSLDVHEVLDSPVSVPHFQHTWEYLTLVLLYMLFFFYPGDQNSGQSGMCSKHLQLLSHLPRPQASHFNGVIESGSVCFSAFVWTSRRSKCLPMLANHIICFLEKK